MRERHLQLLACPKCGGCLEIASVKTRVRRRIAEGLLACGACQLEIPVLRGVPRFVADEHYTRSFGFEWQQHPSTQVDSQTGVGATAQRFFDQTKWPDDLSGDMVLEVGAGAGRFTEVIADTDATVVSIDRSQAVEVNQRNNGHRDNVLVVQADLFSMPVARRRFERVFCGGVLQHTPAPGKAFHGLIAPLRGGGSVVVDVYSLTWRTLLNAKYWLRPLTKRLPHRALYRVCARYVDVMWPLVRRLQRSTRGRRLAQGLLFNPYGHLHTLSDAQQREWSKLDIFDMLSPAYDRPQTLWRVRQWFDEEKLTNVEVEFGWNGIVGRGVKAEAPDRRRTYGVHRRPVPSGRVGGWHDLGQRTC